MTYDTQDTRGIRNAILTVSAASWIALLVAPTNMHGFAHHSSSLRMLVAMGLPLALARDWVLMIAAMMSPVLFLPLCHLQLRSFARRRLRSMGLFVIGYVGIWMAAGSALLVVELCCKLFASQSKLPAAVVSLVALVWQCSPVKQRCINRCHAHTELSAYGAAADIDAIRFGLTHGAWCSASCWALMLLPMLLSSGHFAAMAVVTALVFSERLERARPPDWRWRGFGKLVRIMVAQSHMRWRELRPAHL